MIFPRGIGFKQQKINCATATGCPRQQLQRLCENDSIISFEIAKASIKQKSNPHDRQKPMFVNALRGSKSFSARLHH